MLNGKKQLIKKLNELAESGYSKSIIKEKIIPQIKGGKPLPKKVKNYFKSLETYNNILKKNRQAPKYEPSDLEKTIDVVLNLYKEALKIPSNSKNCKTTLSP
ncbi:MAG: hypothetical protein PVI75_02875 [Gammaproteobacteria bacterium]|jgi:hypothetical protein